MELKNKHILVYGLGESGRAVIKFLQDKQSYTSFYDDDIKYWEYTNFERNPDKKKYDLVIISPGVKCKDNKLLEIFRKKNIEVISELDFAYLHTKGKIIGITGTNGKTTTAMLTHRILQEAGYETFLCGNIGLPMTAICEKTTNKSLVVCEVSNFQLETSKYFRPNIACILNIKPDHIDRHGSFEEYKNTKAKIAQKMKMRDVLYLNFDDKETKKMLVHKNYRYFSKQKLQNNVFVDNDYIYIKSTPTIKTDETKLAGEKNLENILASISICSNFKIKSEQYQRALKQFAPAKHRIEIVGTIKGVTYVDDSKATNIASTIACVEAFKDKNKIVLMGGLGKDIEYDDFFSKQFSIKEVICFGSDADKIKNSAEKYAYKTTKFQSMFQAVLHSKKIAENGDWVLFSPACASFDEFANYAERGTKFQEIVLGIDDGGQENF